MQRGQVGGVGACLYEEAVVLRTHRCNESTTSKPPSADAARLCRKFVAGFLQPLQGRGRAPDRVRSLSEFAAMHRSGGAGEAEAGLTGGSRPV